MGVVVETVASAQTASNYFCVLSSGNCRVDIELQMCNGETSTRNTTWQNPVDSQEETNSMHTILDKTKRRCVS